jgi:hypothetical protein
VAPSESLGGSANRQRNPLALVRPFRDFQCFLARTARSALSAPSISVATRSFATDDQADFFADGAFELEHWIPLFAQVSLKPHACASCGRQHCAN